MPYKTVRALSDVDAAYIAGLIDGEGSVTLTHRHANERRQLVVSIANTEHCLLSFVIAAVGAGKITRKRTTSALHRPSFCYSIANRQALDLLQQIRPFLKGYKRERASLVLRVYVVLTPRNGKYTLELRKARDMFEAEFLRLTPTE